LSVAADTLVLGAVLATSAISGVFGMAGGLILMGLLTWTLPVAAALTLHGLTQLASNGSRVALHLRHVNWKVVGWYALGAAAAMLAFGAVSYAPSKAVVFLGMGLLPIFIWLPERYVALDAARPSHAVIAGLASTALALLAGISGPLNDLFLTRSALSRHQVISTKAALQMFGHLAKVAFYGAAVLESGGPDAPPPWLMAAAAVAALCGVLLGSQLLERISDDRFRRWRKWIFTAIAFTYLVQAAVLFARGG
jgi:uncharacterized membrane protein YfcA